VERVGTVQALATAAGAVTTNVAHIGVAAARTRAIGKSHRVSETTGTNHRTSKANGISRLASEATGTSHRASKANGTSRPTDANDKAAVAACGSACEGCFRGKLPPPLTCFVVSH
jgi:hypothetical protein